VTSLDFLSTHLLIMELRFEAMLYPTWVTNILMWVISNVQAGHIWPAGHRFPIPAV